jgi:DNA-binding transcriptional LysR family regulator
MRGLRSFVAAAHTLSFTRAAAELEITPQAVSGAVARLEAALRTRLFHRSTRSMSLTEEGARLQPLATDALRRLREAVQSAVSRADEPAGVVRLSVAAAFARRHLLPALSGLSIRYPRVHIEVAMDDRIVDMVREGFDIVIRGGEIGDAAVVARHVCTLSSVIVASPAYLAAAGVPRAPEDLQAHRLIGLRFLSGQRSPWWFCSSAGARRGRAAQPAYTLPLNDAITVSDPEAVAHAAALSLGIGAVSLHHAIPWLRRGDLKALLLDHHAPTLREVALMVPHRAHLAPRVRVVVDHLLAAFKADVDLQASLADVRPFAA